MNDALKELYTNILWIKGQNKEQAMELFKACFERFKVAKGSSSKHQAWPGGYVDHLNETMNLARKLHKAMSEIRPLPFTVSDAILVLFLHDLEKLFKYAEPVDQNPDVMKRHTIRLFDLTEEQQNALEYIHGEGDDYSEERVMGPLAAFCNMCDLASARIWYDQPNKNQEDAE